MSATVILGVCCTWHRNSGERGSAGRGSDEDWGVAGGLGVVVCVTAIAQSPSP